MEQHNGFYVPVPYPYCGGFVNEISAKDGLPMHCAKQVRACLEQCYDVRTAIDGGAYVGTWTVHFAKHFKRVLSFEPIPSNFECLQANTSGMRHVELKKAALAQNNDRAFLQPGSKSKPFNWQVIGLASEGYIPGALDIDCPSVSIDGLKLTDLDLLKLDVERHEFAVLQGGRHTLQRCKPIVLIEEEHDPKYRATQYLLELGMKHTATFKHDRLFIWE